MQLVDYAFWIGRAVFSQRQRSVLTSLGIAIGIAAVALLTSIGDGVRLYLLDSFSQFGTRIIAITPGKVATQGMAGMLKSVKPLSLTDANALAGLPYVDAMVPVVQGTARVEAPVLARDVDVLGVNHAAADAWQFGVALGRFLPEEDLEQARPYAVLGHRLRQEIFPGQNPLGQFVRIGGYRFRVIGVMQPKGQFLGFDLDDVIYIPVGRAMQVFNQESLMEIDIVFSERTTSAQMADRIRQRMLDLHGREDVTLFTQQDMLNTLDDILSVMTLGVAALGGISLLVGGVGVFTIMSVVLRERTAEIGLLRALGCTRRRTLLLFLGEAVVLASLGGLIGLLLVGLLVTGLSVLVAALPLSLNPWYWLGAWLLSSLVGLVAGIAPAWRASRLNPIEALRNE